MAEVESLTCRDLSSVLPPLRNAVYQRPSSSQAQVFRVKFVDHPAYPGGQLTTLREAVSPTFTPLQVRVIVEPLVGPDDFTRRIVDFVVAGGSISWL